MAFQKGQSGNPGGKPKGQTPKGLFREQVNAALPSIVQSLVDAAIDGDIQADSIILAKVVPNAKPQSKPMSVPLSGTLAEQGMQIIGAATTGRLSPDDAQIGMTLLLGQAKLVENSEIITRLETIEAWLKDKK